MQHPIEGEDGFAEHQSSAEMHLERQPVEQANGVQASGMRYIDVAEEYGGCLAHPAIVSPSDLIAAAPSTSRSMSITRASRIAAAIAAQSPRKGPVENHERVARFVVEKIAGVRVCMEKSFFGRRKQRCYKERLCEPAGYGTTRPGRKLRQIGRLDSGLFRHRGDGSGAESGNDLRNPDPANLVEYAGCFSKIGALIVEFPLCSRSCRMSAKVSEMLTPESP